MKYFYSIVFALSMVACGLQPVAPKTPAQSVAAVEGTLTGAYKSVADLEQSKSITREQALRLLNVLDQASDDLKLARAALIKGVPQDATQQLLFINTLLLQYQQQLQQDQGGK